MNKKLYFLLAALAMLANLFNVPQTSAAPSKKLTLAQVIKLINSTKLTPTYLEITVSTGPTLKRWDNTMNGQYREEQTHGDKKAVSFSSRHKNVIYIYGDEQAVEYNAGVTRSPNDAKPVIKEMQANTVLSYLGEVKLLNRAAFHLKGKGKTITRTSSRTGQTFKQQLPDIELWVDKKTGVILKQKHGTAPVLTVTKADFAPKFTSETFKIKLPEGIKIVNVDDLQETPS